VVTDGNEGPAYKKVGDLKFSNDGTKLAYRTLNDSGIAAMVVNGESGDSYRSVSAPAFFLNTGEVVYVGEYYNRKTMVVVVGETEGRSYEVIVTDSLRLDPTGTRFAYAAFRGDKLIIVLDGKESTEYDQISRLGFSKDGQRFAYIAKRDGRYVAVVDGAESKEYDELRYSLFSPDSKRFGFVARRENKWLTIVDGNEDPEYEKIFYLVFSSDSTRIAYDAVRNEKCFVVVDGVEGEECDNIQDMAFSPDSTRFAYKMNIGRQPYPELAEDEQYISRTLMPNGKIVETPLPNEKGTKRILHSMGRWLFVLDGIRGNEYESVYHPAFSPDSKHFAYWASDGNRSMVIVNGVCVFEGEGISLSDLNYTKRFYRWMDMSMPPELRNRFVFDSPTTFHTFAKYEGEVVRLDFTILVENK